MYSGGNDTDAVQSPPGVVGEACADSVAGGWAAAGDGTRSETDDNCGAGEVVRFDHGTDDLESRQIAARTVDGRADADEN